MTSGLRDLSGVRAGVRILFVGDSRSSLDLLAGQVDASGSRAIETFLDPVAAVERCREVQFDLVILDHVMPQMDGIEVTRRLRRSGAYAAVPIILVTTDVDRAARAQAIEAGATDFLLKPVDGVELRARAQNLIELRLSRCELDRAAVLAAEAAIATRHAVEREEDLIWRLARATEHRDGSIGEHLSRVAVVARRIAAGLGLPPDHCHTIYLAAPLHDIGKIGISDAILSKAGSLTPGEVKQMREHVTIGARILESASSPILRVAELIARHHHERWDGKGYPSGLSGTDIPIEARIVAVADVFDALTSARPYKKAWPAEMAHSEIIRSSGTQFDPDCVMAFDAAWRDIQDLLQAEISTDGNPTAPTRELAVSRRAI